MPAPTVQRPAPDARLLGKRPARSVMWGTRQAASPEVGGAQTAAELLRVGLRAHTAPCPTPRKRTARAHEGRGALASTAPPPGAPRGFDRPLRVTRARPRRRAHAPPSLPQGEAAGASSNATVTAPWLRGQTHVPSRRTQLTAKLASSPDCPPAAADAGGAMDGRQGGSSEPAGRSSRVVTACRSQALAAWAESRRASPRPVDPRLLLRPCRPGRSQAGAAGGQQGHHDARTRAGQTGSAAGASGSCHGRFHRLPAHCGERGGSAHEPAFPPPRGMALQPEEGTAASALLGEEQRRDRVCRLHWPQTQSRTVH